MHVEGLDAAAWPLRVPAARWPSSLARADLKWDWPLACVAGYTLTVVGRVHQLFPGLELLRPGLLTGILAIALYLLDRSEERRSRLLWTGSSKWLVALLAWMVLSVPGALVASDSFELVFGNFIKTVLMFFVLAGAVRNGGDVERLTGVYLASAVIYAAVVLSRFDVGAGDDWRLNRLYYYDSNDFAAFALTALPLALYFACRPGRRRVKVLAWAALAMLGVAFIRAGSRGGFLALLAMGGFIVFKYNALRLRTRLTALALFSVVILGSAGDKYWEQMETIVSDTDYNHTQETGRLQIWSRGIGYMMRNPVLGVGPGNFASAEGLLSPLAERQQFGVGVRWSAPHNIFIQVAAELGMPGLALFTGVMASAFLSLRRSDRSSRAAGESPPVAPELIQALMASLIAFVVGGLFLSLAYAEFPYTLIALAVAVEKLRSMGVEHERARLRAS